MAHRSVLAVVLVLTAGLFAATGPVITAQGRGGGPAPAGRFVDNGDETITDTMTGLMWEKKTSAVGSGTSTLDERDVDNTYTWEYAMHDYLDRLNGRLVANAAEKPFTPHNDWRLPTLLELQTIVEPASPGRMAERRRNLSAQSGSLTPTKKKRSRGNYSFRRIGSLI